MVEEEKKVIRVKVEHELSPQTERTIREMVREFARTFAGQF